MDGNRAVGSFVKPDLVRVHPAAAQRSQAGAADRLGHEVPLEAQREAGRGDEGVLGRFHGRRKPHRRGLNELEGEQLTGVVDPQVDLGQVIGVVAQHVQVVAPGRADLGLEARQQRFPGFVRQVRGPEILAKLRPIQRVAQLGIARSAEGVQGEGHVAQRKGRARGDRVGLGLAGAQHGRGSTGTERQETDRNALVPDFRAIRVGYQPSGILPALYSQYRAGQIDRARIRVPDGYLGVTARSGQAGDVQVRRQAGRSALLDGQDVGLRHRLQPRQRDDHVVQAGRRGCSGQIERGVQSRGVLEPRRSFDDRDTVGPDEAHLRSAGEVVAGDLDGDRAGVAHTAGCYLADFRIGRLGGQGKVRPARAQRRTVHADVVDAGRRFQQAEFLIGLVEGGGGYVAGRDGGDRTAAEV